MCLINCHRMVFVLRNKTDSFPVLSSPKHYRRAKKTRKILCFVRNTKKNGLRKIAIIIILAVLSLGSVAQFMYIRNSNQSAKLFDLSSANPEIFIKLIVTLPESTNTLGATPDLNPVHTLHSLTAAGKFI